MGDRLEIWLNPRNLIPVAHFAGSMVVRYLPWGSRPRLYADACFARYKTVFVQRRPTQHSVSSSSMKRFDSKALYKALDERRLSREMSWRQVAAEIGVSVSMIARTQRGGRMEVDSMLAMVAWLSVPVETFIRDSSC